MTLGVDAGGGATGSPSADGSVGAGGAAGGSGGRAGRPSRSERAGGVSGGSPIVCIVSYEPQSSQGKMHAASSSTLADESKFVAGTGVGRPDVSRFTPTRFYEPDCLHPNERGLRILTHAIVQRYFVCPEGPPCVHDPTRRKGGRRRR